MWTNRRNFDARHRITLRGSSTPPIIRVVRPFQRPQNVDAQEALRGRCDFVEIPTGKATHPLDGTAGFGTIRDPLQIRLERPSLTSEQLERREDAPSSHAGHDRSAMAACRCRQKRSVTALRLDILREAKNEVNGQFHSQSPNPEAARPKGEANGCPRLPG
jgi:hypothetical protein